MRIISATTWVTLNPTHSNMTSSEIIKVAIEAYEEAVNAPVQYDPVTLTVQGDGLAEFIVRELDSIHEGGTAQEQLLAACDAMVRARHQLDAVENGLYVHLDKIKRKKATKC